jgi:hypothetical protein
MRVFGDERERIIMGELVSQPKGAISAIISNQPAFPN